MSELLRPTPIEIHNLTGERLTEMMETGHTVIRGMIDEPALSILAKSVRTKATKPMLDGSGRTMRYRARKHWYAHGDSLLTDLRHPEMSRLMNATGRTVREAAKEIGEESLVSWGARGRVYGPRMRYRVHLFHENGFLYPHIDRVDLLGMVISIDLQGRTLYQLASSNQVRRRWDFFNFNEHKVTEVVAEPGDGVLFAATKDIRDRNNQYPEEFPWHYTQNIGDVDRYAILLTYEQQL